MSLAHQPDIAVFEANRQFLLGLAYRLLGRYSEAEDIVQETFIRWHRVAKAMVEEPRSYLAKITTRLCLDYLKSAKVQREEYVGPWLPEPVLENQVSPVRTEDDAIWAIDGMRDLSYALLLTLERLSPLERAAFILHDIFEMPFEEVAQVLEKSSAACRQLASRARGNIKQDKKRYQPDKADEERLVKAFMQAMATQDVETLAGLLAKDAALYSDGGGIVLAALRPLYGQERVTAFLEGVIRKNPLTENGRRLETITINGAIGFVMYQGEEVVQANLLDINPDGSIAAMYAMRNPEKLKHFNA